MRGYTILIAITLFFGFQIQANSQGQSKLRQNSGEAEARSEYFQRQHEDSVKGKMLYEMAQFMWSEVFERRKEDIPKFQPGRVEDFRQSIQSNPVDRNPANVYVIYDLTEKELKKKYKDSSPKEVAEAIISTLKKKYLNKKPLLNLQDFQTRLEEIYQSGNSQIRTEAPILEGKTIEGISPSPTKGVANEVLVKRSFVQKRPNISLGISATIGLILGGLLVWFFGKTNKKGKSKDYKMSNVGLDWSIAELEGKNNRLKSDKHLLNDKIEALERELNEKESLIKNLQTEIISLSKSTRVDNLSLNQPTSYVNGNVENNAKSPREVKTCFAPAAEDPFIEQSKVYPIQSGAAAVMLTIDLQNPDRAEFEFSPYADQAHIINTSITQLDQFFEYTLPSRGFSKIKSAGKGTLQLENGHWVRKTKARLELQ